MTSYDVAVVGAGPAGAALALELNKRGASVALFEATRYDRPRFGETLAPEATPLLRALRIWDRFLAQSPLPSPGTISVWGGPVAVERDFVNNAYGNGWHVDRNSFDAMLCDRAAEAGVRVRTGVRVARCGRGNAGVWLIEDLREAVSCAAAHVVDASGRNGLRLAPDDRRQIDDRFVAVFMIFAPQPPVCDLRTVVESAADGWWYYAPLPRGQAAVAFFCDPQLCRRPAFSAREQLAGAPFIASRVAGAPIASEHVVAISSSRRVHFAGEGWASVGDAAISFDPLSGYGLTGALNSALALADAFERRDLEGYAGVMERRYSAYVEQRAQYYALEKRWEDRPFWVRRRSARPLSKVSQ